MKRLLLYGVPVVALLAIAVPSLMRARQSPGVQGGLGDVRTILSAETGYAAGNGGYFDVPACLASPARCIPGARRHMAPLLDPATGFLDPATADLRPREGYQFDFKPGPPPRLTDEERKSVSSSSLDAFAVVALSVRGSPQRRAFGGDSTGRVCARGDGTMPEARDGRCPADCETLH
jgi:hypothetical protein